MQVILKEDVPNLGRTGDVVNVRDGYGRNFLLPKKKAILAAPNNLKQLEHQKKVVAALQLKAKRNAEELSTKLADLSLTISRDAGDEDKLFGSVTTKDISEALRGTFAGGDYRPVVDYLLRVRMRAARRRTDARLEKLKLTTITACNRQSLPRLRFQVESFRLPLLLS